MEQLITKMDKKVKQNINHPTLSIIPEPILDKPIVWSKAHGVNS